jgi:hypothetical protein
MQSSNSPGPRRSELVNSYQWETRPIAAAALVALAGGVVSDALAPQFWKHHALLADAVGRADQRGTRASRSPPNSITVVQPSRDPAVPFEGEFDDNWLTDRVVAITQLAEELDRATLELALSVVRVEWWEARHETTAPTASVDPELLSETAKAGRSVA